MCRWLPRQPWGVPCESWRSVCGWLSLCPGYLRLPRNPLLRVPHRQFWSSDECVCELNAGGKGGGGGLFEVLNLFWGHQVCDWSRRERWYPLPDPLTWVYDCFLWLCQTVTLLLFAFILPDLWYDLASFLSLWQTVTVTVCTLLCVCECACVCAWGSPLCSPVCVCVCVHLCVCSPLCVHVRFPLVASGGKFKWCSLVCVCMCAISLSCFIGGGKVSGVHWLCVCVCVWEREREREREGIPAVVIYKSPLLLFPHATKSQPWLHCPVSGSAEQLRSGQGTVPQRFGHSVHSWPVRVSPQGVSHQLPNDDEGSRGHLDHGSAIWPQENRCIQDLR